MAESTLCFSSRETERILEDSDILPLKLIAKNWSQFDRGSGFPMSERIRYDFKQKYQTKIQATEA